MNVMTAIEWIIEHLETILMILGIMLFGFIEMIGKKIIK